LTEVACYLWIKLDVMMCLLTIGDNEFHFSTLFMKSVSWAAICKQFYANFQFRKGDTTLNAFYSRL